MARRRNSASVIERASRPGAFRRLLRVAAKVPFAVDLVALYFTMLDSDTPLPARMGIATAILYVISPDFIPGPIDDILSLKAAVFLAASYRKPEHTRAAREALTGRRANPRNLSRPGEPRNLSRPGEQEGRMVRSVLYAIERDAHDLRAELRDDDTLPGWITYKVYTAQDRLQPARTYIRERIADVKENPRRKGTKVQSLIFDRSRFTVREAHKWAIMHGFKATKADVTENTIRVRQIAPNKLDIVATIPMRPGVQAVIGRPKR